MDNFDTQELNFEPEYNENQPQQPGNGNYSQPYSGAGVGRKESPFADSPYVMNHARQNSDQSQYESSHIPPVEPPRRKKKNAGVIRKGILAGVMAVALVASGCGITAALVNHYWENRTEEMVSQVQVQIQDLQEQIITNANISEGNSVSGTVQLLEGLTPGQVYARNVKSVVLISSTVMESYYGQTASGTSTGSGFVLTEDGYVVTNHHVVEGASSISVTMSDGTVYSAQLVGSDSTNDVAVLKMDASGLQSVALGSSTDLIVGDQVVAIGNPLGELTSTMTVGYVSAKDRDVTTDGKTINMIQTDAAINSGNSGGPMFNMNGEVIGITTAKYSGESASGASIEGIGFAIPIDDVMPLIDDLINYGYVTGAYLGVMVSDMDAETASYYGLPVGAYVQEAVDGFCAKAAGVQAKDIIVAVGDQKVGSVSDLTRALRKFKAGDTTTLTVFRSGAEVVLEITLDEKPQDTDTQQPVNPDSSQMPQNGSYDEWYDYFFPFFGGRG